MTVKTNPKIDIAAHLETDEDIREFLQKVAKASDTFGPRPEYRRAIHAIRIVIPTQTRMLEFLMSRQPTVLLK